MSYDIVFSSVLATVESKFNLQEFSQSEHRDSDQVLFSSSFSAGMNNYQRGEREVNSSSLAE